MFLIGVLNGYGLCLEVTRWRYDESRVIRMQRYSWNDVVICFIWFVKVGGRRYCSSGIT